MKIFFSFGFKLLKCRRYDIIFVFLIENKIFVRGVCIKFDRYFFRVLIIVFEVFRICLL